ncbi:hypothetical protein E4U41_002693 [Claviceps citrina]|nr:hypothetical protein E4U41_002693 [Claviceps citrina]
MPSRTPHPGNKVDDDDDEFDEDDERRRRRGSKTVRCSKPNLGLLASGDSEHRSAGEVGQD